MKCATGADPLDPATFPQKLGDVLRSFRQDVVYFVNKFVFYRFGESSGLRFG